MRPWVLGVLAVVASTLTTAVAASPPPADRAFTPAMSAKIDKLAQDQIRNGRTPGLAIGVVADGRLVYARGFGLANIAKKIAVQPDTEFYAGTLTMQFTAAAILLLEQNAKLKLDDKVIKYVPELTVAGDVTIRQLLVQTSGLPDLSKSTDVPTDLSRSVKTSDVLAAANKLKPSAPPGTQYANNPLNYFLAGLVVERAGGEPLSDYLQQHIFAPLVMDRTLLAGDNGILPQHATGYTHSTATHGFSVARPWDPTWLQGGRGLISTIYDLAKWDIEMPILLRVDAVRTMFAPAASLGPTQYGMGWVIDQRGGKSFVWYNGEIPGYRAMNALLPDDHVAVIVLSNADTQHGGGVTLPEDVAARILDIVAPPATAQLDNTIVTRAKEWLQRLADKEIDRTQLTSAFSTYLTDQLVARENFAALGKLQTIVPISSTTVTKDVTLYEFLVSYPHDVRYHYKFAVTADGKIDEIFLEA